MDSVIPNNKFLKVLSKSEGKYYISQKGYGKTPPVEAIGELCLQRWIVENMAREDMCAHPMRTAKKSPSQKRARCVWQEPAVESGLQRHKLKRGNGGGKTRKKTAEK